MSILFCIVRTRDVSLREFTELSFDPQVVAELAGEEKR
jgi:hypothetical protein